MNKGKVEKIAIIGGGSAGWMTAAGLKKSLPDIEISLVESSEIPVVGVGEATIFTLNFFLRFLGLKESEWMAACNASYKYAIRYDNWHEQGDSYWHPFESLPKFHSEQHLAHFWHQINNSTHSPKPRSSLYSDCFLCVDLLKQNRIFRQPGAPDHRPDKYCFRVGNSKQEQFVSYAYHFDAGLFGEYLKNTVAKPNGVLHIIDEITQVHCHENGFIEYLDTKSGAKVSADLFIDCTGFDALLIDKALGEPFDSYSDSLFCDRAIAMQVPYEDRVSELRPYTTATALTAGWVWNIPLRHRIGTGYVYCSGFKDNDQAELEYRRHLGEDRVKDISARHLDMRIGKHRRTWLNNCVAIGLSAGFVEPLESTGLHFIYQSVVLLADALRGGFFNSGNIRAFNFDVTTMMEEVRDFLSIHYALTNREDSEFWREVKYNTVLTGLIPSVLSRSLLHFPMRRRGTVFSSPSSWVCILNGMNYLPQPTSQVIQPGVIAAQVELMEAMRLAKEGYAKDLWRHADYLDQFGN